MAVRSVGLFVAPPEVVMLERIAQISFRRRWFVVIAWVIAIVGIGAVSGALGTADEAGFNLPDTESREVLDLLKEASPAQAGADGQFVVKALQGTLRDPDTQAAIETAIAEIDALGDDEVIVTSPYSEQGARQINAEGTIGYALLQFPDVNRSSTTPKAATEIIEIADRLRSDTVQVELGGDYFVNFEPPKSELIGLVAAVFILLLAFGSVLAVGLPIGVALAGIATGVGMIGIGGHIVEMPDFTITLALMIGLGVGIDYALFIVTRYREALAEGHEPEAATMVAIGTAGRAVMFAGTIVIISLLGMLVMGVPFIRGLGIGAALAVLATMVASLTLLPALLGFVRRRIDLTTWYAVIGLVVFNMGLLGFALGVKPLLPLGLVGALVVVLLGRFAVPSLRRQAPIRKPDDGEDNAWHRWSHVVQRHPWVSAIGGVAVLVVLALPLLSMRLGNSDNGNLPEEQTARRAYDLMAEGFGPGFNGPLLLAMRNPADVTPEQVAAVSTALADTEGVQAVGPGITPPGTDVTIWQVVPTTGPQDAETNQLIDRLREDVLPSTGLPIKVGGTTAIFADFSHFLGSRLPVFMAAVLVLSFLLLMAVFRSVLVPLKAVLLNLLSIGAAYGVVVAVFQWGWFGSLLGIAPGPIESFIPMMLFAIVFGLSMDYEVFLLSRMHEEYVRTGNNSASVADGLAVTARVITSAAAIMVFVFGSFLLEDLRQIKLFGLGLAIAVFLDATIVRMLLVPATMELLGDRNWWLPSWLDRILPRIDVEGHTTPAATPNTTAPGSTTPGSTTATPESDDTPLPVP